jgi:hypothetical protein
LDNPEVGYRGFSNPEEAEFATLNQQFLGGPTMASFLTSELLSAKIREVLSGEDRRCAVAFWGTGSSELLKSCSKVGSMDAKIVCDVSMGGTFWKELQILGAPKNEKLRFLDGLHAKVYISDFGAIVASANASSNGIGFGSSGMPAHLEAGTFFDRAEAEWDKISQWFDKTYEVSTVIDEDALEIAKARWADTREQRSVAIRAKMVSSSPRANSLLDIVRNDPSKFKGIGFVFVSGSVSSEDAELVRKAIAAEHSDERKKILNWQQRDTFTWDDKRVIRMWPYLFFEFYMPKDTLRVFARKVEYRSEACLAVLTSRDLSAIKEQVEQVEGTMPKLGSVGQVDAELARRILGDEEAAFFDNADDLLKRLDEVEYES